MRLIFTLFFFFVFIYCQAQTENLHLQLDKTVAYPPVITDTGGLYIITSITPQGISSTIFPEPDNKYNNKAFTLVLKSNDSTLGIIPFFLNKGHHRNFLLETDSLNGIFRGSATLLYYNADTLVARHDLHITPKEHFEKLIQ